MKKIILVFCGYLFIWLSGCSAANDVPTIVPIPERIETRLVTEILPRLVFTSTPTPVSATPTSTATLTPVPSTPTPQIPPEARLQIKQIQWFDTFPNGYQGEGYLVLLQTVENEALVIDLSTTEKWHIALQSYSGKYELGILSPDEKWIIRLKNLDVEAPEEQVYEVSSAQGETQNVYTLPWDWIPRKSWLNNQQILADKQVQSDVLVYQTMAIDVLTGRKHPLPFDYPDIYEFFTMHSYDYNVYDPSLQYVIYPAILPDVPTGHIVRDVTKRTNILTIPAAFEEPSWSPDGKMFAIGSNTYIFGGYLDGQVKNLTHVEQYNGASISGGGEVVRWSPDGRSIAFSMSPDPVPDRNGNHCLAILNVESEAVTNYCIPGYDIKSTFGYHRMIWAPDSRRLLVEGVRNKNSSPESHCLFIDLEKKIAIDLGEQIEPLYFITTLPSIWIKK